MDPSWIVAQMAEMFAINAEIQGMIALNQYRLSKNELIRYDENAFQEKAQLLWGISNFIMTNRA